MESGFRLYPELCVQRVAGDLHPGPAARYRIETDMAWPSESRRS